MTLFPILDAAVSRLDCGYQRQHGDLHALALQPKWISMTAEEDGRTDAGKTGRTEPIIKGSSENKMRKGSVNVLLQCWQVVSVLPLPQKRVFGVCFTARFCHAGYCPADNRETNFHPIERHGHVYYMGYNGITRLKVLPDDWSSTLSTCLSKMVQSTRITVPASIPAHKTAVHFEIELWLWLY